MEKDYIFAVSSIDTGYTTFPNVLEDVDKILAGIKFALLNIEYERTIWKFNSVGSLEKLYRTETMNRELTKEEIKEINKRLENKGFKLEIFAKLEQLV